jgi:hypothetical protein
MELKEPEERVKRKKSPNKGTEADKKAELGP